MHACVYINFLIRMARFLSHSSHSPMNLHPPCFYFAYHFFVPSVEHCPINCYLLWRLTVKPAGFILLILLYFPSAYSRSRKETTIVCMWMQCVETSHNTSNYALHCIIQCVVHKWRMRDCKGCLSLNPCTSTEPQEILYCTSRQSTTEQISLNPSPFQFYEK